MNVFDFIRLFGGLALFLYGMRIMGNGLKKGSSGTLKKAMEKVTNNPLIGFFLGLVVTCIIQSSTATIVLTSGLVGAGIIKLNQSIGIILGANVGTTVTGQIIRLLDIDSGCDSWLTVFNPSTLAPIAAIVGILLIMLFRFRNSDTIGGIAMGFAILFTGLLNMTNAVSGLSGSAALADLFASLANKPVLGFLAGAGVAFSIQSSSATIGILQALSTTGVLKFASIYSVIIGIYLGDCITTAIVCSIGAKANAKRTGIIHILFNLSEAVLVLVGVTLLHRFGVLDAIWDAPITSGGIANAHTLFNLICALLLLPVCGVFEKLSRLIVRDDKSGSGQLLEDTLKTLDKTFFTSPELALSSAHGAVGVMAQQSGINVGAAFALLNTFDQKQADPIGEREETVDTLADRVSDYLLHLSPLVDLGHGADRLNYDLKCITDFERIGDYAVNLTENAADMAEKQVALSAKAKAELAVLQEALTQILNETQQAFTALDEEAAKRIEPIEEVIDDLVSILRADHYDRLQSGKCSAVAGYIFLDMLVNIERISDQCSNVGIHTISLFDSNAALQQHEYVRALHSGEDEQYNAAYRACRDEFVTKLKTAQHTA